MISTYNMILEVLVLYHNEGRYGGALHYFYSIYISLVLHCGYDIVGVTLLLGCLVVIMFGSMNDMSHIGLVVSGGVCVTGWYPLIISVRIFVSYDDNIMKRNK